MDEKSRSLTKSEARGNFAKISRFGSVFKGLN